MDDCLLLAIWLQNGKQTQGKVIDQWMVVDAKEFFFGSIVCCCNNKFVKYLGGTAFTFDFW